MVNDRRKPEASGLRQLFHEQWTHVLQLVEDWNQQRQLDHNKAVEVAEAIETVVAGTDARLRSVGSYKQRLRDSVRSVLDYVDALVDRLPAAIAVNQESFAKDPLVNSFFVNKEDIKQVFSSSRELQNFFTTPDGRDLSEAYALLFVRKLEKTVFGKSLQGDVMLSDVKQTSVSFSDHQILLPCASEELARKSLKGMLFNSIVEYVRSHMARLRYQQLQDNQRQMQLNLEESLGNPAVYLQKLIEHLNAPMELLKQHESVLRISKMGIRLTEDDKSAANELHLHEVKVGDLPTRIIVLVRYPKSELLPPEEFFAGV